MSWYRKNTTNGREGQSISAQKRRGKGEFFQYESNLRRIGWSNALTTEKLAENAGRCEICGVKLRPGRGGAAGLARDHDHETGKARGLLCQPCNVVLGHYETALRGRLVMQPFEDYLGRY